MFPIAYRFMELLLNVAEDLHRLHEELGSD